jgi:hypothetical protein
MRFKLKAEAAGQEMEPAPLRRAGATPGGCAGTRRPAVRCGRKLLGAFRWRSGLSAQLRRAEAAAYPPCHSHKLNAARSRQKEKTTEPKIHSAGVITTSR